MKCHYSILGSVLSQPPLCSFSSHHIIASFVHLVFVKKFSITSLKLLNKTTQQEMASIRLTRESYPLSILKVKSSDYKRKSEENPQVFLEVT